MSGPSDQSLQQQNQITQSEVNLQQTAQQQQQQQYGQSQAELAPAISYYTALASGNPTAAMSAAGPQISNITGGFNAATESINNNVPAGAGRDYALSQVPIQQNSQVAGTLNQVTNNAFGSLAQLGQGSLGASENFLGGGISAGSAASGANQVNINAAEQSKASTLGVLGSLLGAGGSALGGALFGNAMSGGGGGGSYTPSPALSYYASQTYPQFGQPYQGAGGPP